MIATHTPGPWTISTSSPVDYALSIHGARLKQSGGFPVVADILERTTDGTHEANARLITAAPELLEAVRIQHDIIDRLLAMLITADPTFRPTKSEIWALITSVSALQLIAKATGTA
jgi:hypothetical protein